MKQPPDDLPPEAVDDKIRVGNVIHDAPDPGALIPHGWFLTPHSTGRMVTDPKGKTTPTVVLHAPLLVIGRSQDVETGAQLLLITWRRADGWRSRMVPRAELAEARSVVKLAEYGLPVTTATAKLVAQYIVDYEHASYQRLPFVKTATVMGWHGTSFLAGAHHISEEGVACVDADSSPHEWNPGHIAFRSLSGGDKQMVAGFTPRGTYKEWLKTVRDCDPYPIIRLAMIVSLSAPLLEILGAPGYVLDLSGHTSSGKTTALRVAASIWGDPDDRSGGTIIRTWDATAVGIERTLEVLRHLPLLIDDTARARTPDVVTNAIYAIAQGQGRTRGNVTRTDASRTWRTCAISTGEQPAVSCSEAGGARARTLTIARSPLGGESSEAARVATRLASCLPVNYGTAGQRWISWLARHATGWDRLRAGYAERVKMHVEAASSGPAARMAQIRALLEVTATCAEPALGWGMASPVDELWPEIIHDIDDAAGDRRALEHILSWVAAQPGRVYPRDGLGDPPNGYIAKKMENGLALFRHEVEAELKRAGFSPAAIIGGWNGRGWLDAQKGRTDKPVRLFGGLVRCICVRAEMVRPASAEAEAEA